MSYDKQISIFASKSNLRPQLLDAHPSGARRVNEEGALPIHIAVTMKVGPVRYSLGWRIPFPGSRNPPESTRIRPSTESVRIRNPFL